ncbi:DNA polymerase V [Leucoagaricus sp. SymC.cos]|nr:DNA polymerase V [Leucoagaricus sp. SymC.cos]
MSTALALFWHLSSTDKKERIDASVKLVGALEQFQAQFVPQQQPHSHSDDEEDEEEGTQGAKTKEDGLDTLNAQDVSYSIRRLIRGLASPRESSRLGFAVALTELLSRIDTVTCAQIVTLIMDSSKPQGSMTGQEERDVLFARLFGLMSVIQSGLVVRPGSLLASASASAELSTLAGYTGILSELIALGEKKSWLRESAWYAILLGVDVLHQAEVSWKADAVEATVQQLFVDYKSWSPEKIAVALKTQSLYPEKDWAKLFAPVFKSGDLLSSTNLQALARILKESSAEDGEGSVKSGGVSWKPQLHFVWQYLLEQYFPRPNSSNAPKGSFQDFFRTVVDESLFSATSSSQRKYWGFQVFQKALSRVDEEHMPMLFTKNFMRSWINHLSNHDNYLHKIAQQTATEVQAFVKQNPHLGFSLILQLTGVHGSQNFDTLTKTKTVGSIVSSLDATGIQKYIQWLFSQVDEFNTTDGDAIQVINHKRQWTIEQLFALVRNGSIPKSDEWVQSVLDWLIVHGLFLVKKKSSKTPITAARTVAHPPFSDDLRKCCRARLLSCLSELNTYTTPLRIGDKTVKTSAVASDGEFWVSKVLKSITALEGDSKHVSLAVEVDEDDQELRQKAQELVKKLKTVKDQQDTVRGAELLLLATTLQHYCVDEAEDIHSNSLEACINGTMRMFPEGKKKKKQKESKKTEKEVEDAHEPVDILVDTIIGFLERSTAYLKTTANQVFSLLSESMKESSVDLILTQLERRDPTVEEDEDTEMDGLSDENDEGGSEDERSESHEEADDDEDVDDVEALELRNKIEQALRVNGIELATENSDSEEEELMDDEQMMVIDEQLVEVFRSRTNEKKSGKHDAQREATHFKIRVLDLVDTYVRKQPSNPLVLRFIAPLVDLMTTTGSDEHQLSEKTKGIFSNRIVPNSDTPKDLVVKTYKDIHHFARRVRVPGLQSAFKQASLQVTKCLLNLGSEDVVVEAYRSSLVDFFTRKNSALQPVFFEDFLRQNRSIGWKLRQNILEGSDKALNGHRQSQAFQFLQLLLPVISTPEHNLEWIEFLPPLISKSLEVGRTAVGEKQTLNSIQLKAVIKTAFEALCLTRRHRLDEVQNIWKADPWVSLKSDLIGCKRFKNATGLHQLCDQIANTIKSSDSDLKMKLKKRKSEDAQPATDQQETKRKKVKAGV